MATTFDLKSPIFSQLCGLDFGMCMLHVPVNGEESNGYPVFYKGGNKSTKKVNKNGGCHIWYEIFHIKSTSTMKTGYQSMKKKLKWRQHYLSIFPPEDKLAFNGHMPFTAIFH